MRGLYTLVILDVSKCGIIKEIGTAGYLLKMLVSYLNTSEIKVTSEPGTKKFRITYSVPQGLTLEPNL